MLGIFSAHSQQIEKSLQSSNGDRLGFLEYKPANYDQDVNTRYPVIIFLHGIGERGNGTTELKNVSCCGIPRIIKLGNKMRFTWNGKTETFLVLSPQCPTKYGMWPAIFVEELIKYAKQNLRADPDRIFLTGLSMGGGGTYRFISTAAANPLSITAAATIAAPCTFSNGKYVADAKLPVWSFHASDDPTASVTCTEAAISKINAAYPAVVPIKTIWPTGGHIVWDRVYTDTNYTYQGVLNIYEWFLGQNKNLPVNKLPVAKAGADLVISTGTGMSALNASASTDADGRLVRYVWKKISGPSAGVIANAFGSNSATTVSGLSLPGIYTYELAVVDDRAAFDRDTVRITVTASAAVPNKAPIARAGNSISITLPADSVKLDGSASSDADGTIKTYSWSQLSGPSVAVANGGSAIAVLHNMEEGYYTFRLTVTDNKDLSAIDSLSVIVNKKIIIADTAVIIVDKHDPSANQSPVANAGADKTIKLSYTNKALLNATLSTDADGWVKSFAWTKISGPAAEDIEIADQAKTFVSNLTDGVYVFRVTTTDNLGAVAHDDMTMTVSGSTVQAAIPATGNKLPVANAGADRVIALSYTSQCPLNGTRSDDADGWIKSFSWKKLNGPASGSVENINMGEAWARNLAEGVYTFRLTVKDNAGDSAYDDMTITVNKKMKQTVASMASVTESSASVLNAGVLQAEVSLFPNPASSAITLQYASKEDGPSVINIYDVVGKKVKTVSFTKAQQEENRSFAISDLKKGLYFVELKIGDKTRSTIKFIKS